MGPDTIVDDGAAPAPETLSDDAPAGPPDAVRTGARHHWGRTLLAVVFFLLLGVHCLFLINPRVLYQADEVLTVDRNPIPVFPYYYQGKAFFEEFTDHAGGLAEYAGANVGQYFGVPYGATAVLLIIAVASFLVTDALITLMGGRKGLVVPFVPALLLLVMWNQYVVHLGDMVGVMVALVGACVYFRLPDKPVRALAFVGLTAAVCYVAGGALLLTVGLCALYELFVMRRRLLGVGFLLAGAGVYGAAVWLLGDGSTAMAGGLTGQAVSGVGLAVAAWVGLHVLLFVLPIGIAFSGSLQRAGGRLVDRLRKPVLGRLLAKCTIVARPALLIILLAVIAAGTYNVGVGEFRRLSYAAQMEQWPLVLKVAHRNPGLITPPVCRMINRALYEEGHLIDDMFTFQQIPVGGLLPQREIHQPFKSDTLLKLGAVNRTEHLALETMELWGRRPFVIRLLARVAMVKGEGPTARVWLNMLAKDIVHQSWAIERLNQLQSDPSMRNIEEVADVRAVMLAGEGLHARNTEEMLLDLLETSPGNRMAFEYLMAHYLLVGHLEGIVVNVDRLAGLDYVTVPDHIGEALLLVASRRQTTIDLGGLALSARTAERKKLMDQLSARFGPNRAGMFEAMRADPVLAGSYFRYYLDTLPSFQTPSYEP
jgi:hypothetical protein